MNKPLVTILMATYNGAKFIKQQLDSLICQSYTHWQLLIRDDGSTDDTVNLIRRYMRDHENIKLYINETANRGAGANFSALFDLAKENHQTDYIMFCDQDDDWFPDKVEVTLRKMQETESHFLNEPVLIYGSMQLIAEDGRVINEFIRLLPELQFERTIVQNFAFGCTMMLNKSLITLIDSIPTDAGNHDHWIALITSAFGKTGFLSQPLLGYRQHGNNVTLQGNRLGRRLRRFTSGFQNQLLTYKHLMRMLIKFNTTYGERLNAIHKKKVAAIIAGYNQSRWIFIYQLLKNKTLKLTGLQNAGMIYTILFFYSRFKEHPKEF